VASELDAARRNLVQAEEEYQRARIDDYVTRLVRDSAIVEAHRLGMSSREISSLIGDIGQPNVVRARRRAIARREVVPGGMLGPGDAVRESGLSPRDFVRAVRTGRISPVEVSPGVRAFRVEDVEQLKPKTSSTHR
jgi:hypothetical protein